MPARRGVKENPLYSVLLKAGYETDVVTAALAPRKRTLPALRLESRREAIATMMKAGYAQREMVDALANQRPPIVVSLGTVNHDVRVVFARWYVAQMVNVDEAMNLDLSRLDDAIKGLYVSAKNGKLDAVDRLTNIVRLRKDIIGYGAAERLELSGKFEIEIDPRDALLSKLNTLAGQYEPEPDDEEEEETE